MPTRNRIPFDLPGFEIDQVDDYPESLKIQAHSTAVDAICPDCGQRSGRVHSYYTRSPRDLPCSGRKVRLILNVRRFRCLNEQCKRKTFAERIPQVVPVHGQRTNRLTVTLQAIAFELSAEAGSRVTHHLNMAVSGDTILRIIRQVDLSPASPVRVLGVDDWAFKKGRRYGTILVDLEQHRLVDLLAERTTETLAAWLTTHPEVEIVSRDRSKEYKAGITLGAPQAIQVADRWHLLRNLGDALYRLLQHHPKALRTAAQTAHERLEGSITAESDVSEAPSLPVVTLPEPETTDRQVRFAEVKKLATRGYSCRAIARHLQMHRKTVERYMQSNELPERNAPPQNISSVTPYMDYLQQRWADGCHNRKQLWQEICAQGFTGSYMSVYRALRFLGNSGARGSGVKPPPLPQPADRLSPRQAMWLLVRPFEDLSNSEQAQLTALRDCCPPAATAYSLAQRFVLMVSEQQSQALNTWLADALDSDVSQLRHFARGLRQDYAAVHAALKLPWSNGQVEGQVNRLKVIKRIMYGRANFDLLRLHVLHPP